MTNLQVTRLVANPLGDVAPPGERGDIVKVTNGSATIYLDPAEFAGMTERTLRRKLAEVPLRSASRAS
jgi:ribosomal protein L9